MRSIIYFKRSSPTTFLHIYLSNLINKQFFVLVRNMNTIMYEVEQRTLKIVCKYHEYLIYCKFYKSDEILKVCSFISKL